MTDPMDGIHTGGEKDLTPLSEVDPDPHSCLPVLLGGKGERIGNTVGLGKEEGLGKRWFRLYFPSHFSCSDSDWG